LIPAHPTNVARVTIFGKPFSQLCRGSLSTAENDLEIGQAVQQLVWVMARLPVGLYDLYTVKAFQYFFKRHR
jgi:hypothetical protein